MKAIEGGGISNFNQYRAIPDSFCYDQGTVNNYYNYYEDSNPNSTFNAVNGWTITAHEKCNPLQNAMQCGTYTLESVRYYPIPNSKCTYCPYHLDPFWYTINQNYDQTGYNNNNNPLFGPCLNNQPSLKMACLQHPTLFPKKFFGDYYYPQQNAIPEALWREYYVAESNFNYPIHRFLENGGSASPYTETNELLPPSNYSLGKSAVIANLDDITFVFTANGSLNVPLTNDFKRPYITSERVEQWMKWAQFFCNPGCHKNDRYSVFNVRSIDIKDDPELSYLSLFADDTDIELTACRPCPPYTASYNWIATVNGPAHPKTNILADQCYPWFGAIPSMIHLPQGFIMNATRTLNINTGKIVFPNVDTSIHPLVCPVNTYNRVCAHTKEALYITAHDTNPTSTEKMKQYDCTQCPPGYHTNGKIGQWYCVPPIGKLFLKNTILKKENVWGDRNNMIDVNYELECGYKSEHCRQCPEKNLNSSFTPEIFNEVFIFSKLLVDAWCTEGSYCPDAYTQITCPPERPWSPQGSWVLSNCTCAMGKYWNSTMCIPCTAVCTTPGYYLPLSECMNKNDARADGICRWCDNIPDQRGVPDGSGFEIFDGKGACPYHCISDSEILSINSSLSNCEKKYMCKVPTSRVNSNSRYLYREEILIDSIQVTKTSSITCSLRPLFSVQLTKLDDTNYWQIQPLTCVGQCSKKICYAQNQSQIIDSSIPWYSVSSSIICSTCPSLNDLPETAYLKVDLANDLRLGINYCQDPKVFCYPGPASSVNYFNKTSWECLSCNARELAICPPRTSLRGNGCLGVDTPFNITDPRNDCSSCPITVPNLNETKGIKYLNYKNSSAVQGCSIDPCRSLPSHYYWKRVCGADFIGEQLSCSVDCPLNQFRYAECSVEGDLDCRNCTLKKAGYKRIANCSLFEDSIWQKCEPGYFCEISGKINSCPLGKTTVEGADDITDCFCKVGTIENDQGCQPMQCLGTSVVTNIPSQSLNSSYYMTLDVSTMRTTKCVPCSLTINTAFTRGDGLEISSCVCRPGFYGIFNSLNTQIQCSQCPSSCPDKKLPPSCISGDLKVPSGQTLSCACALAPFSTTSNPSTCTSSTCIPGFNANTNTRDTHIGSFDRVSGSSLHTLRSSWNIFLATSGYTSLNNSVKSISVSGCMDDSILGNEVTQVYHSEYVFWIISDAIVPVVFSALLQETNTEFSGLTINNLPQWLISANNDILLHVAASKWNARQPYFTSDENSRDPWIYIAVLLRKNVDNSGLFYMKVNVFNTTLNKNMGHWESNTIYNITLFPSTYSTSNAIPVSIAHSNKRLGQTTLSGEGGFFYTSFNTWDVNDIMKCGGFVITSPIQETGSIIVDFFCTNTFFITSMMVTLNQGNSAPLVYLSLSTGAVLKVDSLTDTSSTSFSYIDNTPLENMLVLFTLNNPIYIATINSGVNMKKNIKTMDLTQTSWLDIQGLPWGSYPTAISYSVSSSGKAILIATYGTSIFTIPIFRCASQTQYWDGVSCVEHSCIRQIACVYPMVLGPGGVCICADGYYLNPTSSCSACLIPSYCTGGNIQTCPITTVTTKTLSSSINNCICNTQGNFFNTLLTPPKCAECRSLDRWCPNRWSTISCPGNFAPVSTIAMSLITYPTKCLCDAGYTGAKCKPCPEGFYCPLSTSIAALNTAAYYTFAQTPLTTVLIGFINSFFLTYFTSTGTKLPNFATQNDLDNIMYTEILPATNKTLFGIMIMIQIEQVAGISTDNFKGWNTPLLDYMKTNHNTEVSSMMPSGLTTFSENVAINKPLQCMTSKVPGNPPSVCICAPGYETNKEQCSPCAANTFKAISGPGLCVQCPIGSISAMKASSCTIDAALSGNQNIQSTTPDITLLIGGISGGVIGLILILLIVKTLMNKTGI